MTEVKYDGFTFSTPIKDYNLIKWCEQFLTPYSMFIDIGAYNGAYSIIFSKICNKVFACEGDHYNELSTSIKVNNINNVSIHQSDNITLDDFSFCGVDFMKVSINHLNVIKGAQKTIETNNYPPIIFEVNDNELIEFLKSLGYKVILISGTNGVHLACDHAKRISAIDKMNISEIEGNYHKIAKYYFGKKQYEKAIETSLIAKNNWQLDEIICNSSLFIDSKHGYSSCDNIVFNRNCPWEVKNNILNLQHHFMKPLPVSRIIPINIDVSQRFSPSSTSIIKTDNGFRANLRSVNYYIENNGGYTIRDKDGIIRSKNYIIEFDNEMKIVGVGELIDNSGIQLHASYSRGMEDIRLFDNNKLLCTYLQANNQSTPQICYAEYDKLFYVNKVLPLSVTEKLQSEKNWMPFIFNDNVYFIYSICPLKIYKLDVDSSKVNLVIDRNCEQDLSSFRGSAGLIPYKNGLLGTIHQVYHNNPRKYFHRFIWFNTDFNEMKYSKIFYFDSPGIEFNLSICLNNKELLVPYSFRDNSSRIAIIKLNVLDNMFENNIIYFK